MLFMVSYWQNVWMWLGLLRATSLFGLSMEIGNLAYEVATYAHDRPHALADMPPVKPMKVTRDGKVVVCYAATECARNALVDASHEPTSRLIETTITRNYLGALGIPQKYVILVIPPESSIE
jgi:hypothetical protein